jgi:hypothetical protein
VTTQRERVDLLAARLVETEVARLEAVAAGNRALHNDLANMNRDAIGEAAVGDLRSLVTRWMLERGKAAYDAKRAPEKGPTWAEVEAWLKRRRDEWADGGAQPPSEGYDALDGALDDLRAHIATGTPLGRPVHTTTQDDGNDN